MPTKYRLYQFTRRVVTTEYVSVEVRDGANAVKTAEGMARDSFNFGWNVNRSSRIGPLRRQAIGTNTRTD